MLNYLARHPVPGYHPIFIQLSPQLSRLRGPGLSGNVYYHLWQQKVLAVASELHQKVGFDLAQHVTFCRYWSPSGLRDLGIPFIWGPVGAAESTPPAFLSEMRIRDRTFELIRDGVRKLAHMDSALVATAKASTIALGTTRETCQALRDLGARRVEQLPLGLDESELDAYTRIPPPPSGPFRALCLGRLLHWKGFYLAIRAFAIFAEKNPDAELWIVGSGPFRRQLDETVAKTGMGARVKILGKIPQDELMDRLARVHVLMHPALHDNFPVTCLEAMAAGRPVVCLDIGGPAAQVNSETGFVAPARNPEESVRAMASFLTLVANDRTHLARLSANARIRVREEFSMKKMGSSMSSLFREAIAEHGKLQQTRD